MHVVRSQGQLIRPGGSRIPLSLTAVVLLALAGPPAGAEETAESAPAPPILGLGAYPLDETVAAVWFAETHGEDQKRLVMIAYFVGAPGWLDAPFQATGDASADPAQVVFHVGPVELELVYSRATRRVRVLDHDFAVADSNVFVFHDVTGDSPQRSHAQHVDLILGRSDNPSEILLEQSPGLKRAVYSR